jgi:protein TonB
MEDGAMSDATYAARLWYLDSLHLRQLVVAAALCAAIHLAAFIAGPPWVHAPTPPPAPKPPDAYFASKDFRIEPKPKPIPKPRLPDEEPSVPYEPEPVQEELIAPEPPWSAADFSGTVERPTVPFVAWEEPPRLLHWEAPSYPEDARLTGWSGSVRVDVLVGRDGRVEEVRFHEPYPPESIREAIRRALRRWMFRPAASGGKPVRVWIPETFRFAR